jgi:hypothetical protein
MCRQQQSFVNVSAARAVFLKIYRQEMKHCVHSLMMTDGISGQLFQTFKPLAAAVFTYLYYVGRRGE